MQPFISFDLAELEIFPVLRFRFKILSGIAILALRSMHDTLGESRPGRPPGLFISLDFITVDRSLWALFEQIKTDRTITQTPYMLDIMRRTRDSTDLLVKKFFVLAGLVEMEEMSNYYRKQTDGGTFDAWLADLKKEFRSLFMGAKRSEKPPTCVQDARYVDIRVFTSKMIAKYVAM